MNQTKNRWILLGGIIIATLLVSGFMLMQPSAEDILVGALDAATTVEDGYALVEFNADTIEESATGTFEVWARRGEDGPGAFRIEVLDTSKEEAQGAVIVSDGETLWAYQPAENKVFVGTPEEAKAMMKDNELISDKFLNGKEGQLEKGETDHPETPEEAVEKLQEYFRIGKSSSETIAGENADLLKLEPIPDQMPDEYAAVGGLINLWISEASGLPVAVAYTGGALGEINLTVLEYEVNTGVDEILFTFDIPEGAEVITFADLEPQSLTLDEAGDSADFEFLTPADSPRGATLVDIIEVRGTIVQRFTLPDGGSFTVAQGVFDEMSDELKDPSPESAAVEVRGVTGSLFVSEDGDKLMLTWRDADLFFAIGGDLTSDQALAIAESLQ